MLNRKTTNHDNKIIVCFIKEKDNFLTKNR